MMGHFKLLLFFRILYTYSVFVASELFVLFQLVFFNMSVDNFQCYLKKRLMDKRSVVP